MPGQPLPPADDSVPSASDDAIELAEDSELARLTGAALEAAKANGPYPDQTVWWSLSRPDGGGVHMRATERDSRWFVTDVYVHGPQVTATMLVEVPVSQVDLLMNLAAGWDSSTIAETWKARGQAAEDEWPENAEPTLAELRERARGALDRLPAVQRPERVKLTRPDGSDPDGFAERVAAAYIQYALVSRAPAVEIAAEADVPVATARSWIREARRRGKLPAGRKGKAG